MRIEARDLEHAYRRSSSPTIRPFSHAFEPGTLTAVTGPSGSGKSTLLYLLALMLTPSGGDIRWGERSVGALPDAERSHLRAGGRSYQRDL